MAASATAVSISRTCICFDNYMGTKLFNSFLVSNLFYGPSVLCLCTEVSVTCKQALRGDLAAGREKEGELATMSQEFEFLHRKSRCKMLIGGDLIW